MLFCCRKRNTVLCTFSLHPLNYEYQREGVNVMIVKHRTRSRQLEVLEALQHRSELNHYQQSLLSQLQLNEQLELEFEQYIQLLNADKVDIIWQFNYSDYHQDALINLLLITDEAIYLFKLNHYSGLHYINNNGMLCDYFSDEIRLDLVQLNCVKYSIYHLLEPGLKKLPIHVKAVCLNETFMLDVHADSHQSLFKKEIPAYLNKITSSSKKKLLPR